MKTGSFVYPSVFGVIILCFVLMPFVLGDDIVSTSVTITGAAPTVGTVTASDDVDISSPCGTVTINCSAVITDANGYNDVQHANATIWDSLNAVEGDSDNNNNHYTNLTCLLSGGSGSNVNANCSFTVQYYANPSNWTCKIYANDTTGNSASNSADNITIITFRAIDAEDIINFDSLAPGGTSTDDVNNTVTNCGNVALDLNLSGTNLTNVSASVTNITVSNVKYNVTYPGSDYTVNMTSLSASSIRANFSLAKRTTTVSTGKTYWKIAIPSSIENLIYSGTITFTAVEDT
jgi:hypothetical protein